jgi:hypothetical protein
MLTVFFRYRGDGIGGHLPPAQVVRVADAAVRTGLPDLALHILAPVHGRLRGKDRTEAKRILAEAALAKGEDAHAVRLATEVVRATWAPATRRAADRVRGEALLRLGRLAEAAPVLRDVGGPDHLLALGRAYLQRPETAAEAAAVAAPALRSGDPGTDGVAAPPADVGGLLGLAQAAEQAGERTLAASALRTALERAPAEGTGGLHYRLAHAEAAAADPAAAAAAYTSAAANETDPLLAQAAAASAAYYRLLGRQGDAP